MGFLNFIVVFLFWPNIRDLVLQPQVAFLDKLCIPQDDETLKNECILGLAGYLRVSQKLVILWSERYFRRVTDVVFSTHPFFSLHLQSTSGVGH